MKAYTNIVGQSFLSSRANYQKLDKGNNKNSVGTALDNSFGLIRSIKATTNVLSMVIRFANRNVAATVLAKKETLLWSEYLPETPECCTPFTYSFGIRQTRIPAFEALLQNRVLML